NSVKIDRSEDVSGNTDWATSAGFMRFPLGSAALPASCRHASKEAPHSQRPAEPVPVEVRPPPSASPANMTKLGQRCARSLVRYIAAAAVKVPLLARLGETKCVGPLVSGETDGPMTLEDDPWSRLLRMPLRRRPVATLGHELIKLGAIACKAQPLEEFAEFALLLFEAPHRLGPILVERVVAARGRLSPPAAATAEAIHLVTHPIHLVLEARYFVLPVRAVSSTSHTSAPDQERQDCETQRPPHHEAEDEQHDPGRTAQLIELCCDRHGETSRVNVNNINIDG